MDIMPTDYIVEPFQPGIDDQAEIASLHLEVRRWQEKHQNNIFSNIYDSQSDLNAIEEFYMIPGGNFFVARNLETGKIAGFVGLKNEGNQTGRIMRLAVMEEHRRRGIGLKLMQEAVSWASQNDFSTLRLATGFKEKAKHIYERVGFTVVGTKNDKDHLMECKL